MVLFARFLWAPLENASELQNSACMELLCGHESILLMTTLEVTSEIYSIKFLLGREAKKEHRSSLVRHQRSHQSYLTVLRGGTKNLKKGHHRVRRRLSAARLFLGCQGSRVHWNSPVGGEDMFLGYFDSVSVTVETFIQC